MKLHTYLKTAPQCISITGPTQSGKTTMLQEIGTLWTSAPRHALRAHVPDLFWIDAFTELPNQSFLELYNKKLRSFCTTPSSSLSTPSLSLSVPSLSSSTPSVPSASSLPSSTPLHSKQKWTKMLVIDDVDLYPIPIQTQIYAIVQRHKSAIHICISYTCPNHVIPSLVAQFIPISTPLLNKPLFDMERAIQTSLTLNQKEKKGKRKGGVEVEETKENRFTHMVKEWIQLHKNGLLLSDIFALIGECILHSPDLTDEQIFQFYSCYKKCPVDKEHVLFIYLLADALASIQ